MEGTEPENKKIVPLFGDRFIILSDKYIKTDGIVYYRDADLLRILPQGVSDRLYDFPIVRVPRFGFDPEIGVQKYFRVKEADFESFVEMQDLHAGTYVETFTATAEPRGIYMIDAVDEEADSAVFQEIKDGEPVGKPFELVFDGFGIPLEAPFAIIRPREMLPVPVAEEAPADALLGEVEEEAATPAEAVAATLPTVAESDADGGVVASAGKDDEEEEFDLEVVGYVLVPRVETTKVLPQGQRLYSDAVQKGDALQDFTNMLSLKQQQDLRELRRIRTLTETLFALKQEIIEYSADGMEATAVPTSADTLIDLIKRVPVPLGRPVLDTEVKIYELSPKSDDEGERSYILRDFNDKTIMVRGVSTRVLSAVQSAYKRAQESGLSEEQVATAVATAAAQEEDSTAHEEILEEPIQIVDLREELDQIRGYLGSSVASRQLTSTVQFWLNLQGFMATFASPWRAADTVSTAIETWAPVADSDFFRGQIPCTEERCVRGIRPDASHKPDQLFIGKLYFSLGRALKQTYYHTKSKQTAVLFNAESAPLKGYLLFPQQFRSALGATRSGFLVQDVINSQSRSMQMTKILRITNGVSEEAKSGDVLAIGLGGNTSGDIKISEYLKTLPLNGFGPADMMRELSHLGLNLLELNLNQGEVINGKIANYVNRVKAHVAKIREKLAAMPATVAATDPLFSKEDMSWFMSAISGEPILATHVAEFTKQSPQLAASDYAVVSYLVIKNLDYLLAAAAKNEAQIARELLRATRINFLSMLRRAVAVRDAPRGAAPKPNLCPHVVKLRDIRRIEDPQERYRALVKFLVKFQGPRNANYVQCAACNKELLCVHELIELKIFMNPREREPLHKELLLHFSGPVMGNTYQCRNCGQPLGEIDYDNNMEFDDAGRPMMGYAVLPEEAKQLDEVDKILGAQDASAPTSADFGNEKNNFIYGTIKELADRIGVYPTKNDYIEIINSVNGVLLDIGDRAQFIAQQEELRKQAKQLGKTIRLPDYEIVVNRSLVVSAGAYLLVHVQTKIPDYMPTISVGGCKNPGFRGWPIDAEDNRQGQEYIACVISTIMRNAEPWNMSGFQSQPIEAKRQKMIFDRMGDVLASALDRPEIQLQLAAKRKYRTEVYGSSGEVAESISSLFLPPQKVITGADAVAAGTTIMEGVKAAKTMAGRSDYWIQIANRFAEKTALERGEVIVGNPFAVMTTCYGPLSSPHIFWDDAQLPELDKRILRPGALASRLMTRFVPRAQDEMLASVPDAQYYVLFLKVCFTGERYGLPHEPGLTHKCPHCDFQFPGPIALMDVEREGKAALESQSVEVNAETFKALLNEMHKKYSVPAFVKKQALGPYDNLRDLAIINPEPAEGWTATVQKLITDMQALPPDAAASDILQTLTPISQIASDAKEEIVSRLKKRFADELFSLADYAPNDVAEFLTAYFIVPMNRLITDFDATSVQRLQPQVAEELSPEHKANIETEILKKATSIQAELQSKMATSIFARAKFAFCVKQLSPMLPLLQRLNATNIPGGNRTLKYLLPAMVLQPFAALINPNMMPPGADGGVAEGLDNSMSTIISFMNKALVKFNNENLTFTDDSIKNELQISAEKEKMVIIKDFDGMTEDEKRVELMKKQLGIGPKWSRGGSKQVRLYNKDIWEAERIERIKAGISDFGSGGVGPNGLTEGGESAAMGDANGIFNVDGGGPYEDTGYDLEQVEEGDF